MSLIEKYKQCMTNKIKLIRTRNQKFKNLYSNNTQYGGTDINDDVVPISNIIEFDNEMDKNTKLIDEYLTELDRLYTTITEKTGKVSQKELDKLAQDFQVKEETILAQNNKNIERIKQLEQDKLTNTTEYEQSLSQLEQQKEKLASTISSITSENDILKKQINELGGLDGITNQIQSLKQENEKYQKEIAQMGKLSQELLEKQNENKVLQTQMNTLQTQMNTLQTQKDSLQKEVNNLPTKIHQNLEKTLQNYDNKLIQQIQDKENTQVGGKKLKKIQESCKIFANEKKLQRNLKKLFKVYDKFSNVRNKFFNKNMKIYVKKNNIKETHIKKELEFLFKNRSKYLNNQTIFMGGQISDSNVYNEVVSNLLQEKLLPHKHVDNIYKKLKTIIKGEVSDSSEAKDVLNSVYIAVLGEAYDSNDKKQQKFLDKATTIKILGKEIIDLLTDCDPTGMDIKFISSYNTIIKRSKILRKLIDLISNGDESIHDKAWRYLPIDSPIELTGGLNDYINQIYTYYNKTIQSYTSPLPEMIEKLQILLKENWEDEDNKDIKQEICKQISVLETSFRQINRGLDLSYIINKYEDISGAVRVYVRINDYGVNKDEIKKYECSPESLCLGRSYTIQKINNEESTFIVARNPCEQDPFYNVNERIKSIQIGQENQKTGQEQKTAYTTINEQLLDKYNMLGIHRYGSFFGTYENVSNKDIFEGIESKTNNPALRDALLQSTQGYSIILFGYGYSGSGKSYTLLNGENSMLNSFMSEAKKIGVNISISKISELYGRFSIRGQTMRAGEYEITESELSTLNPDINFENLNSRKKEIRENQINILLSTIEELRSTPRKNINLPATVKGTPNNPASSRSHLFITLRVRTKDGTEGYLTLVDMAGIENPIEIAVNIFPFYDLRNLVNPFRNVIPQWASINISEFTSSEIAKKKLLDYFGEVCYDFQKVEREICTSFKDKYSTAIINSNGATNNYGDRDWKMITDCDDFDFKNREGHTIESGYISSYEDLIEPITFTWNGKKWSTNKKIEQMYEIQGKILTSGEAFTLLKEAKEAFYYSGMNCDYDGRDVDCIDRDVIKSIHAVLSRWLKNLTENSNPWKYIQNLLKLRVKKRGTTLMKTTGKEKYTLLMNYCFGCMILNGIVKDYNDIENGIITYEINESGEVVKKYLKGFLNGVEISETEYNQLVEEGIFINETINHLAYYFKKKNNPNTQLNEDDELKELYTRFDATQVLPRSMFKKETTESHKKYPWDDKISLSLKTYLPSKFLFDPEELHENVLIKYILNTLDGKSQEGKPSKFIMMCLLRPEIDAKYCTGARATLNFAESVCSTCT